MSDARAAYSIAEVCAKFGVGRTTVYNAIKNGALQTRKVGRRTLVTVEALDLWIGGLPMGGAPSRTIAPPIHNRHSRVKLDPLNQSGGETKRLGSPKDLVRTNSLRAPDDQTNGFDELLNASIDILNREHSASRISLNEKAISIVGLAAGCMLDRMGTAALETKCSNLSRARKIATAALMD